jgi:hypothetical protein
VFQIVYWYPQILYETRQDLGGLRWRVEVGPLRLQNALDELGNVYRERHLSFWQPWDRPSDSEHVLRRLETVLQKPEGVLVSVYIDPPALDPKRFDIEFPASLHWEVSSSWPQSFQVRQGSSVVNSATYARSKKLVLRAWDDHIAAHASFESRELNLGRPLEIVIPRTNIGEPLTTVVPLPLSLPDLARDNRRRRSAEIDAEHAATGGKPLSPIEIPLVQMDDLVPAVVLHAAMRMGLDLSTFPSTVTMMKPEPAPISRLRHAATYAMNLLLVGCYAGLAVLGAARVGRLGWCTLGRLRAALLELARSPAIPKAERQRGLLALGLMAVGAAISYVGVNLQDPGQFFVPLAGIALLAAGFALTLRDPFQGKTPSEVLRGWWNVPVDSRRVVGLFYALGVVALCLYVPWEWQGPGRRTALGHGWIWNPPRINASVDLTRVVLPLLAWTALAAAGLLLLWPRSRTSGSSTE